MPDQLLRELLACLEHAGSFGFCGSGKVLTTSTMEPLLLSAGIKQTGFPSLCNAVIFLLGMDHQSISALPGWWPKEDSGDIYFASRWTITWTYGQPLWNVSWYYSMLISDNSIMMIMLTTHL